MAKHPLETKYGLSSAELLDAIESRFRLKVAVEGAVAEFQMAKHFGRAGVRYEAHDLDGQPDFSIWLPGREKPILAECKNVRESGKEGGEAYRVGGKVVAYKVETQKTRAAKGDPSSRYYGLEQYHILGVCLGKKTGDWSDFLFVRTIDLERHSAHSHKLAVMQRVPLPTADNLLPWYADIGELLRHFDDPPCSPSTPLR
ncbi:MAG: hypothetical protein DCC67_13755 [Planctomycetota bacterium]|nr:MAG: hypothetical protein DCC67_13755 [Planctomycetota bacterium]